MSRAPSNPRPKPPAPDARVDGLSFEEALREVEAIIERIEAGEVGLEQSLAEFDKGIRLIALCKGRLEQAQQRVIDLTNKLAQVDNESGPASPSGRPDGSGDAEGDDSPF